MKSWSKTLLLILFIAFISCGSKPAKIVVVIEKTKSYHTRDCSRVFMAKTKEMTREEAKAKKLTPCPYCKPGNEK